MMGNNASTNGDDDSPSPNKRPRIDSGGQNGNGDTEDDGRIEFYYTEQGLDSIPRNITHLTVAPTVREIEESAFESCIYLVSAIIPATVKVIGEKAFYGCTALIDVQMQENGLKQIDPMAFACCTALVEFVPSKTLRVIGDVAFGRCESLRNFSIPETMPNVGASLFWGCKLLVQVKFHNGLKVIGDKAFFGCKSLCYVEFPSSLEMICEGAFEGCSSLTTMALPSNLEEIEPRGFASCEGLLSVEISATSSMIIESQAFADCAALMNLSVPKHTTMEPDAFTGCYLLNDELGEGEASNALLQNRYDSLPVHKILYHSLDLTEENLVQVLQASNSQAISRDAFGLTPFHILATSLKLQESILECLLNWYPIDHVLQPDKHGLRMLDYLLWNTPGNAVSLIWMLLRKTIITTISSWKGGPTWESTLISRMEEIGTDDNTKDKIKGVHAFMEQAGYFVRVEFTSILELALWKSRLEATTPAQDTSDEENDNDYRRNCRLQCGADVVIENVSEFLWYGKTRASTALLMCPLSSMVLGSEFLSEVEEEEDDDDSEAD